MEGRYDEAVAELQLAAAANPGDVRIFSRLGSAWFRKDQPEQAVDAFSKAIAIEPDARRLRHSRPGLSGPETLRGCLP